MRKYIVVLESDVFGAEEFYYNTRREQEAGYRRLLKSARQGEQEDGIERHVYQLN